MNEGTNLEAFLTTVCACEGTLDAEGRRVYNALFGYPAPGRTFASYHDHPRRRFSFKQTDGTINYTTAAGAFQFIVRTWDVLAARLELADFSPESQDEAAIALIRERKALGDAEAGRLATALDKCARVWASLPNSIYPQPRRAYAFAEGAYLKAGGTLA